MTTLERRRFPHCQQVRKKEIPSLLQGKKGGYPSLLPGKKKGGSLTHCDKFRKKEISSLLPGQKEGDSFIITRLERRRFPHCHHVREKEIPLERRRFPHSYQVKKKEIPSLLPGKKGGFPHSYWQERRISSLLHVPGKKLRSSHCQCYHARKGGSPHCYQATKEDSLT